MATIKAIERQTVHQIQSGQVIVDLCSVVKELVENSLDAGATSIDVRFKNQGLDAIEVQDNGSGISPENYETLALKHYTSKLATYSDLTSLETFGFRGEALSSLCALSNFTVTTCLATDVPKGTKLEYETSGKLRATALVAAQKGTSISVEQLFKNLPVRRRELERNIKREWNRVISVLNQYACIQAGVKLSVSQQPTKGKRITLFSTKGNKTTRENIVNVFGAKTLTVLIPLDLKLELEPSKTPLHLRNTADTNPTSATTEIHVRGHVSRPAHGEGRQTPDRQMFFVNGRPCGLPQFAKVFNEVYKAYNASQSPFICADIQLDTHLYDVNVSPDKRTILLHEQPRMLDNLREALIQLFEAHDYAVPTSTLTVGTHTPYKRTVASRENTISSFRRDQSQSAGNTTTEIEHRPSPEKGISEDATGEPSEAQSASDSKSEMKSKGASFISQFTRSAPGPKDSATDDYPEQLPSNQQAEEISAETPADDEEDHEDDEQVEEAVSTNNSESATQRGLESPIPALAALTHTAGTYTSQISVPSRSKRPAPELATITIGDSTVTSILGEPCKRTKTRADSSEAVCAKTNKKAKSDVPSFQGRLSQMFAAAAQNNQSTSGLSRAPTSAQDGEDEEESDAESEQLFVRDDDDIMSHSEEDETAAVDETMMSGARSLADAAISGGDSPASARDTRSMEPPAEDGQSIHGSDEEPVRGEGSEYEDEEMQDAVEGEDREVAETEETTGQSLEEANKRTQTFMKGSARKYATRQLQQTLRITESYIHRAMVDYSIATSQPSALGGGSLPAADRLDADDAEAKLSLTISKTDFLRMKIIGQFNLGFIIAVREGSSSSKDKTSATARRDDELFIIDQHATDEKYNFERLQASTVVQSQRLVQPKQLDLTALEEEVIKENLAALEANGFQVDIDESGFHPVGQRVRLLSLPLSRETTFDLVDLEELVSLLTDHHEVSAPAVSSSTSVLSGGAGGVIPRPSKVRKMFAMRACRSSVMIGKSLTHKQMERLVRHMGELDKPWNCPHGRPTMRHLCGLAGWEGMGWREGGANGEAGEARGRNGRTDWAAYLRG